MVTTFATTQHVRGVPPIKILETETTFDDADRLAKSKGSTFPTIRNFIKVLGENPAMLPIVGESYWLREKSRLRISENCRIDYEKGTLEEVSKKQWRELPVEQRARIHWTATGHMPSRPLGLPLILYIKADWREEERLYIDADYNLNLTARVALVDLAALRAAAASEMANAKAALARLKRGSQ